MGSWEFWTVSMFVWSCMLVLRFELSVAVNEDGMALVSFKEEQIPYSSLSKFNQNYPNGNVESMNVRKASRRILISDSIATDPTSKDLATQSPTDTPRNGDSNLGSFVIAGISIGAAIFLLILLYSAYMLWNWYKKDVTVIPWPTGLSGKLQKAFVTGTPSLRRSELEVACEHFSNIIGSLSNCELYKGTLSSGVEIAVTSTDVTLAENWSENYQTQYRNKISVLSKINHKNFMNLIGYCEEEEPFTRMMVFEYTPNGTLFEHLHIKEAEPLEWSARLRIAMGIVYCLEHIETLSPSVTLRNINSSCIYLTDDYAAKVSDLEFWTEEQKNSVLESSDQDNIVYKFGIILLEIISGRRPFSADDGLLVLWASSYLNGKRPIMDMVDQTLTSVGEETIVALVDVVRSCINKETNEALAMEDVAARMRQITAITPEQAYPRLMPMWWSEIEVITQ